MSWSEWWHDIKELFVVPPKSPEEPEKRFLPPHSLPDSELPPKWPDKPQ